MNVKRRLFMGSVAALGIIGVAGPALAKKQHHHLDGNWIFLYR